MKKRTLAGVIALGVIMVPVLSYILVGNNQATGLVEDKAVRTLAEIESDDVVLFDDEAIALANASGGDTSLRAEAIKAYNLVNDQREAAGLSSLTWNGNLESVASVRAEEASVSFSHTRPNGKAWYSVNSNIMAGENLAYGFNDAGSALNAWMNSPTHKENILWPEFTEIAIAVYVTDNGTYYWSQEFGY